MLNQNERDLLKILYKNSKDYITANDLAIQLNVSDRTIRNYIKSIREKIEHEGASIKAKTGSGYYLSIADHNKFIHFFERLFYRQNFIDDKENFGVREREYYILNQLFFKKEYLDLDLVMKDLYISEATLYSDFNQLKDKIKRYDLELRIENKKAYISGDEQNKRHFIINYFFMNRIEMSLKSLGVFNQLISDVSLEEILIIVLDECRNKKLQVSDMIIYNVVLHIGLAIQRILKGFKLDKEAITTTISIDEEKTKEYLAAQEIINRLEKAFDIKFPAEEVHYLLFHLQKDKTSEELYQQLNYSEEEIRKQLDRVLIELDTAKGYKMSSDSILKEGILTHIKPLLARLLKNESNANPLLEEIQNNYGQELKMTKDYIGQMPVFHDFEVNDHEWAYLAIHLMASIERYINESKVRALVVCASGAGSAQMLKTRLESELGSKIIIHKTVGYFELQDELLNDVDLIISAVDLPNLILNIPIVTVNVLLTEADIQAINNSISLVKGLSAFKLPNKKDQQNHWIKLLRENIKPNLFLKVEGRRTKKSVLNELIRMVEKVEKKSISEKLWQQLKLRETFSSVLFTDEIAVPHPIESVTSKPYFAIAVSKEGIIWDSDYENVQLVFLLLPDIYDATKFEEISKVILLIMEDLSLKNDLVESGTFDQFKNVLITYIKEMEE